MRNRDSHISFQYLIVLFSLSAMLSLFACVSKPTPSPATPSPTAAPPTATTTTSLPGARPSPVVQVTAPIAAPTTDPQTLWKTSEHANTFVVDAEGRNNDCARCHAPLSWMPTAIEDIPATCQTCKFNMPVPKPVAQAEWKNIGCEQCHKTEKGVATKQVAWLNAAVAQFDTNADPYETVTSNAELCEKCHRDAFQMSMSKTVHAARACTDCHNAHSTTASCTDSKCHADTLKRSTAIAGHDAAHAKVACAACHDAAGLEVGPTDDKSGWAAFRTVEIGGKKTKAPYVSHNLQRSVDCARCHAKGNPWGLNPH